MKPMIISAQVRVALALGLMIAAVVSQGIPRLSAAGPAPCTTAVACASLPEHTALDAFDVVTQFTVQVSDPRRTSEVGATGSSTTPTATPSPAFQRSFQAMASIPSPSPTPVSQHAIETLAAIPTASPAPGSLIPTQALGAIPPPAALTPTLTNGKNVLTLTPAETGQTAAVPLETSIFLRFGPGDHQISVSPATGVLEGPKGAFALPNDDIGILEAVGRGTATITVTSRRSATGTAGNSSSPNWSGYVESTGTYTSISGSWEVPSVQASAGFTASSSWIGIDGFNNTNLIQTGTEQDYNPNGGGATYFAWWEILPAAETAISTSTYPVSPGDSMSAQISRQNGSTWSISLSDTTAGWTFSTQQTYSGSLASAEWIQEATSFPTGTGGAIVPATLANYGSTLFDSSTMNGANPGFTSSEELSMVQGTTQVSTPSAPNCQTNSFVVAYGATTPNAPLCFNQLTFNIVTGGDDLRGDSSATASVVLPTGTQTFTLKSQSDGGWSNGSSSVRTFPIAGPDQPVSAIGPITITLTSNNGTFETDDNWNIENASIQAAGANGSACVYNQNGDPLSRLTGSSPSVTLNPGTDC